MSSAPRPPTGSRSPTGSAPPCSSPSTGRTSPRTAPPAASTFPPRISTASASLLPISTRRRPAPKLRELMAFEVDRARSLLDEGAPLVGRLGGRARIAVAGLRRRGPRRTRRDRRRRLRRARGLRRRPAVCAARGPRSSPTPGGDNRDRRRACLRALPPCRPGVRLELLRGHAAAPAGAPQRALRGLRPRP